MISRCSAGGSAPVSGTGGREFESRHFDHKIKEGVKLSSNMTSHPMGNKIQGLGEKVKFLFTPQPLRALHLFPFRPYAPYTFRHFALNLVTPETFLL